MNSTHPFAASLRPLVVARGLALLGALLPLGAFASSVWQINLVGDLYPEGREGPHPAPGKPVYYYPVIRGFTAMGAKLGNDAPPPAKLIVHELAAALSAEGYFVTSEIDVPAKTNATARPDEKPATVKAFSPPPSLILVFNWGSLRAEKLETNADVMTSNPPAVLNQNQMIGLTAGRKFDSIVDFGTKTEEIWDGIQDDRFFVMVSAYDFKAYNEQHQRVRLWVAKMSMPAAGVTMTEIMPALIKSGREVFGRETIGPKLRDVPSAPEGHVEVGTPTEVSPKP